MTAPPLVTVLIPARNEAADIERCLAAVAAQDLDLGEVEILVVDGMSEDDTEAIARRAMAGRGFESAVVLTNPLGSTPTSLNAGLAHARGDIVCRVDARTIIEPHYVRTCRALLLSRPDVAVVGGSQVAVPRDGSTRAVGIARALNNRWSMGGSPYRRATASGISDTVYLGAFRRADLEAIGGWDVRLGTNQDFDLNRRISARGTVWFDHTLRSGYVPRASLAGLWRQYRRFGQAKVDYWRLTADRPVPRQVLLLAGLPVAVTVAIVAVWSDPRWIVAVVGGAVVVEHAGGTGPKGNPAARGAAVVAMGVVAVGWWTGVIERWLRRHG